MQLRRRVVQLGIQADLREVFDCVRVVNRLLLLQLKSGISVPVLQVHAVVYRFFLG